MSIEKLLEEYPNDKIIFMNKVHWDNREEDQKDGRGQGGATTI